MNSYPIYDPRMCLAFPFESEPSSVPLYLYQITSSGLQYSDVRSTVKNEDDVFKMVNIAEILIIENNLKKATEIRESIKNNIEISDDAGLEQRLDIMNTLIKNMEHKLNSLKPDDYESDTEYNDNEKLNEIIKKVNNQNILDLEKNMNKMKDIKENLKHDKSLPFNLMLKRLDITNTKIREIEEQLSLFKSNDI